MSNRKPHDVSELGKPKVSVVIPSYKAEKTISRTINSLLSQKKVRCEVIVVEDGVFDNTASMLTLFDCVKHIQIKENRGAPHARNLGLSEATADYILFLDADDYHEGEVLYGLVSALESTGACIGFGRQKKIWEPTGSTLSIFVPRRGESNLQIIERWLRGNSGPGTTAVLWRKETLEKIGGWNVAYKKNQDGELILRAMFNGVSVAQSFVGFGIYIIHERLSISKDVSDEALASQKGLDGYLEEMISSDFKYSFLWRSLSAFRFNNSVYAYSNMNSDVGRFWEAKWRLGGGTFRDLCKGGGINRIMLITLFFIVGIERGLKFKHFIQGYRV